MVRGAYAKADQGQDSHYAMQYEDRADAGAQLAEQLAPYAAQRPLVLGIPRGGVVVARAVAERLAAPLDVIVARKLGAQYQEEVAIGAVTADGSRVLNDALISLLDVPAEYLDRVTRAQRAEAERRERAFRAGLPPLAVAGRSVIVVDDGLATGATMRACIHALKRARAESVVIAVPVGSAEACRELSAEVDTLICPWRPDPFFAVGAHYQNFDQVSDEEVTEILRAYRAT